MDVFKIAVRIFAAGDGFGPDLFVKIFHRWIQNQSVPGHLLIDVADYAHVVAGPGTVLVSTEANFHVDRAENRLGVTYLRKRPLPGPFQKRLFAAASEAIRAAVKLEQEPELAGKLKFRTDEIAIRLNDRLLAPANAETVAAVKPDVQALARILYGNRPAIIEPRISPPALAELRIKGEGTASAAALLERLDVGIAGR